MTEKNTQEYESLKQKLFKLIALADRGVGGEADNARRILRRLAAQHGISLEDLDWNEKPQIARFYVGRSKLNKKLFEQCYAYVTGEHTIHYRTDGTTFWIDMLPIQAAELGDLWGWHKSNMAKEYEDFKDTFINSYIMRHNLYPKPTLENDKEAKDIHLTKEDLLKLRRTVSMAAAMSDRSYLKGITDK